MYKIYDISQVCHNFQTLPKHIVVWKIYNYKNARRKSFKATGQCLSRGAGKGFINSKAKGYTIRAKLP